MAADGPYDVIVIGGGPAGSTAACYLAMKGYAVILFERETFPRYRLGESLLPSTTPVLEDLGVLDAMEAAGFPRKTGGSFTWGADETPWSVRFSENPFLPSSYGYHVERSVFDKILLDRAIELGTDVMQPCRVKEVLVEEGRVVGVSYIDRDTEEVREVRARFTIDGSGPASVVGRKMTTRTYDDRMRQTSLFTYYKDVAGEPEGQEGHVVVTTGPMGWFWYIPMNSDELGEASVGLVTGQEFRPQIKEMGAERFFEAALAATPKVQAMLGPNAKRVGGYRAIQDWAFVCGQLAGPGYFLAGDAAAFIDPLLSTGVTLAMLAAYSASVCIHTIMNDGDLEQQAIDFYDGNYKQMYSVTRDCLLYFYSGNLIGHDDVFWQARRLMKFGDNAGAKQAFSFLVNTVAANPHPAAARQIHMFHQFMDNLEHPIEEMADEPEFTALQEANSPRPANIDDLTDATLLKVNGHIEDTCVINAEEHLLEPVRGIAYDAERPVFSSTASWLLGRNFASMDADALALLELVDGERDWRTILDTYAAEHACTPGEASEALEPSLHRLTKEAFLLWAE